MNKKLKTVTISGADNGVSLDKLVKLSERYPFVEWGILMSPNNHGKVRYPTTDWIRDFTNVEGIKKSCHLCGNYVRSFAGTSPVEMYINELIQIIDKFDRVQLNLSREIDLINPTQLSTNIGESSVTDFILQLPNNDEETINAVKAINAEVRKRTVFDLHPFLDASGGAGVIGRNWKLDININGYKGFAGGINPQNVNSIMSEIAKNLSPNETFWIDMESGIRTDNIFDLNLVEDVLSTCQPFILE